MTITELIAALEAADGPSRELDAEIMFDLYARPFGRAKDGGPKCYLWPEDNPSWSFGLRFPGKDATWFFDPKRRREGKETLIIWRDGAWVLMNDLRIPRLTASLDAALTLVPEGCAWDLGGDGNGDGFARLYAPDGSSRFIHFAATPALAFCIAALKAREAME